MREEESVLEVTPQRRIERGMTHRSRNCFELYRLLVLGVLEERLKPTS